MEQRIQGERGPHFVWRGSLTSQAIHERAAAGSLPGPVPAGYQSQSTADGRRVVLDPDAAPLVRELFWLAATTDMTVRELLAAMREKGMRSRTGRPVGISALYLVLTNPFYYGSIQYQRKLYPGAHETLIDKGLFERVQERLAARRRCRRKQPLLVPNCSYD